jgi:hypothetical protein
LIDQLKIIEDVLSLKTAYLTNSFDLSTENNKCKQIIRTNNEEEKIRTMGKRLKLSYINAARDLRQKEVRILFYFGLKPTVYCT